MIRQHEAEQTLENEIEHFVHRRPLLKDVMADQQTPDCHSALAKEANRAYPNPTYFPLVLLLIRA
jgi:hypothetical protein